LSSKSSKPDIPVPELRYSLILSNMLSFISYSSGLDPSGASGIDVPTTFIIASTTYAALLASMFGN
jgi:hypothetical protein